MAQTLSVFPWPLAQYYFQQPWTISGQTLQMTMRYNTRAISWFMDISDSSGMALLSGRPLKAGVNLLAGLQTKDLPAGKLLVMPLSQQTGDPGRDDMGVNFALFHLSDD